MRRFTLVSLSVLGVLVLCGAALYLSLHQPRPTGLAGAEADALARRVMDAAGADGWANTGAVRWTFRGANRHLWDRRRNAIEVRWGEDRVLMRLDTQDGLAFHAGLPLDGARKRSFLRKAYRFWANDSFWLNPLEKLHDDGVVREHVVLDGGQPALLVRYTRGGVTPGDAYLWHVGPDGLPTAWQMWVKLLPIGGVRATWEGWKTLATGARVSTHHALGPVSVDLSDVEAAPSLRELVGDEDPFARLYD